MSEQWFTQEASTFLSELSYNNSKQWYLDNKEIYRKVLLQPLIDFVCELSSAMLDIDDKFEVRPQTGKTISRIFCDARYSKGRIFKDNMWVTFKRSGASNIDYPSFFFEFSPNMYRYGMGFFSASPKSMSSIRGKIDENEKAFIKIISKIQSDNIFIPEGQMYKKEYYKGKNTQIPSWYNRKNIYLVRNSDNMSELYTKDRISGIRDDLITLKDIYGFFKSAVGEKQIY